MRQGDFEAVLLKAAPIFLHYLLCKHIVGAYPRRVCVPSVVSPMGDKIGYIVDGQLVTNEEMRGVLNDERGVN